MRNKFSKFFVFLLILTMIINSSLLNSIAASQSNNTYSSRKVNISHNVYELYITNNQTGQIDVLVVTQNIDGTCSSKGWIDVKNVCEYKNKNSDFQITVNNGVVLYSENDKVSKTLGVIDDTANEFKANKSPEARIKYPTSWYADETKYGSINTELANIATIVAALLGIGGLGLTASTVITIANYILANKLPSIYFAKTRYSRVLSPCEQEYYYKVKWYKNSNYTGLIGTSKGGTEIVNLC